MNGAPIVGTPNTDLCIIKITLTTKTMKKFIENPIQWWKSLEEDHKWLVVIAALWVVCFLPHSFIFALFGPIAARVLW